MRDSALPGRPERSRTLTSSPPPILKHVGSARLIIDDGAGPDFKRLIAVDKAASSLFEPTGLLSDEALQDHVPVETFEAAASAGLLWVARLEGIGPVGFCLASHRDGGLYIDQISVDPIFGKRGIGRALMLHAETIAKDHGTDTLTLSTFRELPWNAPFYASLGFKPVKRSQLLPYMLDIEREQASHMDVTKRLFMRKRLRKRRPAVRKRV